MTLGHFIMSVRKDRGMTREKLAQQIFVSAKAVQFWEQDRRLPRLPTIRKLAKALRLPTERLLHFVALSTYKRVG